MGSEVIILPVIFGVIFGIYYLYITARNRERLALIEKGADASIFYGGKRSITPVWKIVILNLALLLMGIGLGLFLGNVLEATTTLGRNIYPAVVFFMAGTGLLIGFYLTKKMS